MRRTLEVLFFFALACGLHVAFVASARVEQKTAGSGAGGEDVVSVAAASATVIDMVATWERPPLTPVDAPDTLEFDVQPEVAPVMPSFDMASAPNAAVTLATLVQPDIETLELDSTPAAPPPPPPVEPDLVPSPVEPKLKPKPKPRDTTAQKAKTQSEGRAKQQAAGRNGGAVAGASTGTGTAAKSNAKQDSLKAAWRARIHKQLNRAKRCPAVSATGTPVIRIRVSKTGQLLSYSLRKSSGNGALDQAAVQTAARAGRVPPAPKGLTTEIYRISVPILLKCK